jgi:hypothetical protein
MDPDFVTIIDSRVAQAAELQVSSHEGTRLAQ